MSEIGALDAESEEVTAEESSEDDTDFASLDDLDDLDLESSIGLESLDMSDIDALGSEFEVSDELDARVDDLDSDFDALDLSDFDSSEADDDLDFGSTAAVEVSDETLAVEPLGDDLDDLSPELNDREVDIAKAKAIAEANAHSVELDFDAEDPFAAAAQQLTDAESDSFSKEWDDDSVDSLLGEEIDLMSLDDAESSDQDEEIDLIEVDSDSEEDIDFLTDVDDESDDGFATKGLDEDLLSTLQSDMSDLGLDDDFLSTIGADLSELEVEPESDDFLSGLNDTGSLDTEDTSDDLDLESLTDDAPATPEKDFDADATVMMTKKTDQQNDAHFDSLDDAFGSEDFSDISGENPKLYGYGETADLDDIQNESVDPMEDIFNATSELEGLMNDLSGLLDEDEDKNKK